MNHREFGDHNSTIFQEKNRCSIQSSPVIGRDFQRKAVDLGSNKLKNFAAIFQTQNNLSLLAVIYP